MAFFYNKPKICTQKMISVRDVLDNLPAFNALYQLKPGQAVDACNDFTNEQKARWMTWVREGAIYCGGEQTELDFFERTFNGNKKKSEASEVYVRYNCDRDFNIYAETTANSVGPGQAVVFTMLRSMHAGDGKWSNVAVNGNIYLYEDMQWLRVTNVDKTVDYAHVVTAIPFSAAYTATVPGKKKMMFTRVRLVDGYSCSVPSSSWDVPGYVGKFTPFRARADWEIEVDLLRPYQEVLRYAITFDLHGNQMDGFEMMEKTRGRQEFQYTKNLMFFLGQKVDNPLLIGAGLAMRDNKYGGFDGYINSLRFGGGYVQETDPTQGYMMGTDFQQLMIRQDAMKETTEFFTIAGMPWMMSMIDGNAETFKNSAGACTFNTFDRSGLKKDAIEKLGIASYKYLDFTLHFKRMSALSDTRSIGNYNMPYMAFMMPGTGLKDDNGESVSPIEFYEAGGTPESGTYEEIDRDHRKLESGCEKLSGTIAETFQMAVHCPKKHVLLYPKMPC